MRHRRTTEQQSGGEKKASLPARKIREEGGEREGEREREGGREGGREGEIKKGRSDTDAPQGREETRGDGEMRTGAHAREIREERREDVERKKKKEKESG